MKIETTLFQVTLTKKMKGKYCEDVEKENTCTLLLGMYISRVMENRKGVPQKNKKVLYDSATERLRVYPNDTSMSKSLPCSM